MFRHFWWRCLALFFVLLGLIGAVLPVMPTTVFMLLAAWAAGKGWPSLHDWLLSHPRYGPSIRSWQQHRAVPRRAKWLAGIMMTFSMLLICLSAAPVLVKWLVPSLMCVVLLWLWTRPDRVIPASRLER